MDWKFWISLVINIIGVALTWRSLYLQMTYQNPAVLSSLAALPWYKSLWKRYWPILVMVLLTSSAWIPYWIRPKPQIIPVAAVLGAYGYHGPTPTVYSVVDMAQLQGVKDIYRVMVVTRVLDPRIDPHRDTTIEKSHVFDITGGAMPIEIPVSLDFYARARSTPTRFVELYVVLLPKDIRADQVSDLADIETLGGKNIEGGGFSLTGGS